MVADAKMVEYHGQPNVESYVLTIMNMVRLPRAVRGGRRGRPEDGGVEVYKGWVYPRPQAGGISFQLLSPGGDGRPRRESLGESLGRGGAFGAAVRTPLSVIPPHWLSSLHPLPGPELGEGRLRELVDWLAHSTPL